MSNRDIDTHPYSDDEQRVVDYLHAIVPDAGAGSDPIGFLIASHNTMVDERREQVRRQAATFEQQPAETLVPPRCKEDVVDLLFQVQTGACSCRKAASLLFPEFNLHRIGAKKSGGAVKFVSALFATVETHSEQINGQDRYGPDGRDSITLEHQEWREVAEDLRGTGR